MFRNARRILLFTLVLLFSRLVLAEIQLNGLSLHSELNQELFIGAYYSDQLTDSPDNQFDNRINRRLEMRILSRLFSARRVTSLWIEGVSINSPEQQLSKHADKVTEFAALINHSLRAGDQLVIDAHGDTVDITVNGLLLGSIESKELFNMLLSTWIGSVPPSSSFRDGLLGNGAIDQQLWLKFDNIKPAASRRDIAHRWAEKAEKKTTPTTKLQTSPLNLTAPQINQLPAAMSVAASPETPESDTTGEDKVSQARQPDTAAKSETERTPQPNPVTPEQSGDATAVQTENDVSALTANLEEEDEEELEEITVASLVTRKRFHTEVISSVYKLIRYPSKAVSRGQEGTVQVELVIDREGNIISATETESSLYSSLNNAAMRAIRKAEPYPRVPKEIPGETHAFKLPITFRLPK